ncbi:glutamate-5-semialdehyde dehydrogenase [Cladophialophora bantiana CBS 173.52]|uniref:glutamate-5-semialdehyde dehydrogenase n=1 Tax=Cladophialophora bantiana (strain ATCC 10958 / CBS 173.52 / CDC B-1940 / NIH 8579) TaxID=1442370 RepID=A0A0D2H7J3_CLAB1|nr:glutamate-5-semialdehyde dehydrogenase [Cladophialophora bantiana CBS 173.52]KIW89278.1 glutamate-5-semialdehyde dehydrogenase [Cladophialophora bantiana CBS 173.52]
MSLTNSSPVSCAQSASLAAHTLSILPLAARNAALTAIHAALVQHKSDILAANALDMARAQQASSQGELSQSVLKRLDLGRKGKYEDMLKGILDVRDLHDPIGRVDLRTRLDQGLELERVSCPIGVLLIIFEARPEVIANISALAIKSGNAAILKGGKESSDSFEAIAKVIGEALASTHVPVGAIQLVKTRDVIDELLDLDRYIDLVIPRGGNELVRYVKSHTKIPVLGHADGLCSVYLHKDAEKDVAVKVVVDSKCDYPAACNAAETLLVHEAVLKTVLPSVVEELQKKGVSLRCDEPSKKALTAVLSPANAALLQDATEEDFSTEFLDLVMAVKTIPGTPPPSNVTGTSGTLLPNGHSSASTASDEEEPDQPALLRAIAHINTNSSHHTDAIVTRSSASAEQFMSAVDSAGVYWNASTRFADGMRYGFGTEVGISTNKIHSRGPVGLEGLTIYKYKIRGRGQGAGEYGDGEGKRSFLHEKMEI